MRLNTDYYAYANPFLEPISLERLAVLDEDDSTAMTYAIVDPSPVGEDQIELAEEQAAIRRFLNTLGARDRELVDRIFWNNESQADVARSFAMSGAAISKRLGRIAARGRKALAPLRRSSLLQ